MAQIVDFEWSDALLERCGGFEFIIRTAERELKLFHFFEYEDLVKPLLLRLNTMFDEPRGPKLELHCIAENEFWLLRLRRKEAQIEIKILKADNFCQALKSKPTLLSGWMLFRDFVECVIRDLNPYMND